ncbi:MAG: hypothetical protein FJZ01_05650 [Candidatus Sericytochromatia bacterium]|nr:hypothetical protein [Candidatus Tanganyikabacteria bacterium]
MQDKPKGNSEPTRPFQRGRTTPFGDEFVSSGRLTPAAGGEAGTRPLPGAPGQNLIPQVTNKIGEIRRELDYIRHLVNLFAAPVNILRVGVKLSDPPPESPPAPPRELPPDPGDEFAAGEDAAPEDASESPPAGSWEDELLMGLSPEQADLARHIGLFLRSNPKVKQRAQVCLFQYEEAFRSYQESQQSVEEALKLPPAAAWDKLHDIGIERVKGKAYAICGFYENFKTDGPLGNVFPPPRNKEDAPQNATRPLTAAPPTKAPTKQPPGPPPDDDLDAPLPIEHAIGGLLGKLKGLFK